jgi:hypothetical protein
MPYTSFGLFFFPAGYARHTPAFLMFDRIGLTKSGTITNRFGNLRFYADDLGNDIELSTINY